MRVRFWGVRGSIASPGKDTVEFGGNTSCVEIEDDSGQCLIFDAGTGIRELGRDLARRKVTDLHLFISHTHWDHIQGFPFFTPAYIPGNRIHIYGPIHYEKSLRKIMDLQMDYAYFPVSMQQLNSRIEYSDLKEETLTIGETRIITRYSNHPVTGLCYKIISGGKTVVITGDTEPYYNVLESSGAAARPTDEFQNEFGGDDEDMNQIVAERNEAHRSFCASDLLIHDAQYTEEEYPKFKGWGHSSMEHVLRIARSTGTRRVILTHHDPLKTDAALSEIEKKLKTAHSDLDLCFAREGMEIQL